jgi:hypothetical protein
LITPAVHSWFLSGFPKNKQIGAALPSTGSAAQHIAKGSYGEGFYAEG